VLAGFESASSALIISQGLVVIDIEPDEFDFIMVSAFVSPFRPIERWWSWMCNEHMEAGAVGECYWDVREVFGRKPKNFPRIVGIPRRTVWIRWSRGAWEVFPEEVLECSDLICFDVELWIDEQCHGVLAGEGPEPEAVVGVFPRLG